MHVVPMVLVSLLSAIMALAPCLARAEPEAAEAVVSPQLNPLADGRLGPLTALRERPLFAPTRRMPPPPPPPPPPAPIVESVAVAPPPPPAPPPAPPEFQMIGIVEAEGARFALLSRSGGPTQTLRVGDALDAWTVSAIEPQSLTLQSGTREQSYPVFVAKPVATAAPGSNPEAAQ